MAVYVECGGERLLVATIREKFLMLMLMDADDKCWPYRHQQKSGGYGRIRFQKQSMLAHRVSYEVFVGAIPDGLFVCHLYVNWRPGHRKGFV